MWRGCKKTGECVRRIDYCERFLSIADLVGDVIVVNADTGTQYDGHDRQHDDSG
jgi:hypothetical protein